MSRLICLLVIAFTLTLLLGAPMASEAAPRVDAAGRVSASFEWLWRVLAQVWEKEGCHIASFGRCLPSAPSTMDNGCSIDPDGRCAPEAPVNTKEGCRIDPDGRCATSSQAVRDNGCSIDPFGRCTSGN